MASFTGRIAVLFFGFLIPSVIIASPLAYPDFTPRINDEITALLHSLMNEQQEGGTWQEDAWPRAREVRGWAHSLPRLGQVGGVAVDGLGRPVIFHRGPNVWLDNSFNGSHVYQAQAQGAIPVDTVLTVDADTGLIVDSWGRNMFYMPHGIAICSHSGDVWLTDVALHQVFRFRAGEDSPAVTLGRRFEPGSDTHHFCKPTSVAIASTGDVFIADGYCNQRVLRYTTEGMFIAELGKNLGELTMQLPHAVALLEERDAVCVADREVRRITCMRAGLSHLNKAGESIGAFDNDKLGPVYGIAISGGLVFAVTGATDSMAPKGLTIDPFSGKILDEWSTATGMRSPHAIAVAPDGSALYIGEIGPNRIHKFSLLP